MSQDARTKANTLSEHAKRRAYRRQHDSAFAERERLENKRYRERNKWGRMFICAFSQEFDDFRRAMIAQAMREIR